VVGRVSSRKRLMHKAWHGSIKSLGLLSQVLGWWHFWVFWQLL